ncbi:MAG: protein translocase subunit SecD [Pseudomonadota bacterium]
MAKWWWTKVSLVIIAILFSVYYLIPTITNWNKMGADFSTVDTESSFFPKELIKLGLDLQGGIHLVLGVDVNVALENEITRIGDNMKEYLKKDSIFVKNVDIDSIEMKIILEFATGKSQEKGYSKIKNDYFEILDFDNETASTKGDNFIVLAPKEEWANRIKKQAIDQAIETIRNRIDEFGVTEPNIQIQGDKRILVQLPGVKDPARALNIIRRTALLEFKLVDKTMDRLTLEKAIDKAIKEGKLEKEHDNKTLNNVMKETLPEGCEIAYQIERDKTTGEVTKIPYLIQKKTLLTGEVIEDARVMQDNTGFNQYAVSMEFNREGAKIFGRITGANVGNQLAIILDGNVSSAPIINEKIPSGRARITLGSGMNAEDMFKEASDLVVVLRAGSLPAPVIVEENRTVGPSLGKDSITKGKNALLIGAILVIIFMLIYYRGSGVIANFALLLNVLFILAILTAFQATLTLPGIAGIVLTIGMAVDANVIIFERIKEELRAGKSPKAAIATGYEKAQLTILDANLTTLIAAIVLFQYGTGPIQGFAVTLMIGIICSYITALWITRVVFDYASQKFTLKKLSI